MSADRDYGDEQPETVAERWRRPLVLTREQLDEMFPAYTFTRQQIEDVCAWIEATTAQSRREREIDPATMNIPMDAPAKSRG